MSDINLDELKNRAKVIAEATGRSEADVLEDLLDDGVLNQSNSKKSADLVSQLKEAAELINTVQSINKQVAENTVLNGGKNKTEVAVETTLEGDIVDRAIASVQRKAENIKKIALIIAPVFLLLGGGSLEAFGIIDLFESESNDYDPYGDYELVWGCTAWDAENYDPYATDDDGSCYWDNGGGGNDCEPDWWWQNEAIFDHDQNGQGFNNDLRVQVDFRDLNRCNIHMNNGYFEIRVGDDSRVLDYNFHDEFAINEHYLDLPAGDYYVTVDYYTYDGSSWNGPEAWVTMEGGPACDMKPEAVPGTMDAAISNNETTLYMDIKDENYCDAAMNVRLHYDIYLDNAWYATYDDIWIELHGQETYYHAFKIWDLPEGNWTVMPRIQPEGSQEQFYDEYYFEIV
jgi:hypothetical protein